MPLAHCVFQAETVAQPQKELPDAEDATSFPDASTEKAFGATNAYETLKYSTSQTSTSSGFVKVNKTAHAFQTNIRPHEMMHQRPLSNDDDLDYACRLDRLAHALFTRFELAHDMNDLNKAIGYHQEALHLRPPGHPDRVRSLAYLSRALMSKFEWEGDMSVLPEANMYAEEGRSLLPAGTSR